MQNVKLSKNKTLVHELFKDSKDIKVALYDVLPKFYNKNIH